MVDIWLPSGIHTENYGKPTIFTGKKLTINGHAESYVKLSEGKDYSAVSWCFTVFIRIDHDSYHVFLIVYHGHND